MAPLAYRIWTLFAEWLAVHVITGTFIVRRQCLSSQLCKAVCLVSQWGDAGAVSSNAFVARRGTADSTQVTGIRGAAHAQRSDSEPLPEKFTGLLGTRRQLADLAKDLKDLPLDFRIFVQRTHFTPQDLVQLLGMLANVKQRQATFAALEACCAHSFAFAAGQVDARDLARGAWALAKLRSQQQTLFQSIARQVVAKAQLFRFDDWSKTAWAFATVGVHSIEMFHALAAQVMRKTNLIPPRAISTIAWSFAKLSAIEHSLLDDLVAEASRKITAFNPQDLCNLAWSLAKISGRHSLFMHALARELALKTNPLNSQDLSNFAWAFATTRSGSSEDFCLVMRGNIVESNDFKPQEATNLMWALAKVQVHDIHVWDAILGRVTELFGQCKPQDLSNVAWVLATMEFKWVDILRKLFAEAMLKLEKFNSQDFSNLAWACATLRWADSVLWHVLVEHALTKAKHCKPQEAANIIWAFAKVSTEGIEAFGMAALHSAHAVEQFSPRDLSNFAWACAKVKMDDVDMWCSIQNAALKKVTSYNSQDLSNIAWAFAAVRADGNDIVYVLVRTTTAHLKDYSLQDLASVVWAFAMLELREPQAVRWLADEFMPRVVDLDLAISSNSPATLVEVAKSMSAAVWAFNFLGFLTITMSRSVSLLLEKIGNILDCGVDSSPLLVAISESGADLCVKDGPRVILDLPDRMVLEKPTGWEVDVGERESAVAPEHGQLSLFLQHLSPSRRSPITRCGTHHFGFLHRLDVPSSGLVLAAKSHAAYYDLQMQLDTNEMHRDYTALCHGWVPHARKDITARVDYDGRLESPSRVARSGKPSFTRIAVMAHAHRTGRAFSLASIRIGSGRRHQIRTHFAHAGHPTASDGLYSVSLTFSDDQQWCSRNFLHRHSLAFRDALNSSHIALAPLPADLVEAWACLSQLRPLSGIPFGWGEDAPEGRVARCR